MSFEKYAWFFCRFFHDGYEHKANIGFRSAISAYHDPIQGVLVGQNGRVSALLSRIFDNRPRQPKFNFVWGFKKIFHFLLTLECDENLLLKQLTLRLTMFFALTSAARASENYLLDLRFLLKHSTGYIF